MRYYKVSAEILKSLIMDSLVLEDVGDELPVDLCELVGNMDHDLENELNKLGEVINDTGTIEIPLARYNSLLRSEEELEALDNFGVRHWRCYNEAFKEHLDGTGYDNWREYLNSIEVKGG